MNLLQASYFPGTQKRRTATLSLIFVVAVIPTEVGGPTVNGADGGHSAHLHLEPDQEEKPQRQYSHSSRRQIAKSCLPWLHVSWDP